jgi:hypothetical protein
MKEIKIGDKTVTIVYLNTIVETSIIDELVFNPLNQSTSTKADEIFKNYTTLKEDELPKLIHDVCSGYTVLLFEDEIIEIDTFSAPDRSITIPENETTVMGPQDAFVESVATNISLIKKRIRSPQLKSKSFLLGTETKNDVVMLYMDNIANDENVSRVERRLENVEFHGFIGMPVLKQMLEDKPFSPFPQFGITVRSDNSVDALLNGKILVMMNGSPEAAILPSTFWDMFISPEDYYNRWTTASLLRTLRLAGFFISILLTSTYVSVLTYHPEMLPPLTLIPIMMLCKKYPDDSLFKITEKLLGKIIGKAVNVTLLLYGIVGAATVGQEYVRLVQSIVLPTFTIASFTISLFLL